MSERTISIPDQLYEKAHRLAERTDQSVDEVIREHLNEALSQALLDLPADERAELHALTHLSDDTLWTIAREQMPAAKQERMSLLMDRNSDGTITDNEYDELVLLVDQGERLMLRKSEAMKLLMDRGHRIDLADLQPSRG